MANNQAKTIAKRLYGANFEPEVRQTLTERQLLAKEPQPGDSLTQTKDFQTYTSSDGKKLGIGGMSAQTPFIRMWTAVDIYRKTLTDEVFNLDVNTIAEGRDIEQNGINEVCGAREKHGEPSDSYCQIEFGKVYHIEKIATKYHELGNHTLYEMFPGSDRSTATAEDKQNNEFLKASAGIISLKSSTEGSMGLIKKTEITFKVHNFKDYNDIYSRYFLKPGAIIFADFGWNKLVPVNDETWTKAGLPEYSQGQLYQPKHVIEYENTAGFLYGEHASETPHAGWIDYQKGNAETVFGYVTNYSSKQNPDGTYNCSITITSGTAGLNRTADRNMNVWMSSKIDSILDSYLLNSGMKLPEGLLDEMTGMKMNPIDPEEVDSEDEEEPEKKKKPTARAEVDKYFNQVLMTSMHTFLPQKFNVQSGVAVSGDNVYITIDLLEELILNPLYSESQLSRVGKGSTESAPKFNSTYGQCKWSNLLIERQLMVGKEYGSDHAAQMPVLHPVCITTPPMVARISDFTPKVDTRYYNTILYAEENWWLHPDFNTLENVNLPDFSDYEETGAECSIPEDAIDDWEGLHNVWIGDLFISVDMIKRAFSTTDAHEGGLGVMTVVRNLLKDINERAGYMNLELVRVNATGDGQVMITDTNCISGLEPISYVKLASDDNYDAWDDMFVFDVTSGNSIVSNLDINFSMPSDNISNMIAIGSGGSGRGFSPMNRLEDEAISTELATSGLDKDEAGKIIDFFTNYRGMIKPDPDEVLLRKIARDNFNSHMDRVFEIATSDVYSRKGMNNMTPISKETIESYIRHHTISYDIEKLQEPGAYMDSLQDIPDLEQSVEQQLLENDKSIYFEKEGTNQSSDIATWYNKRIKNELYAGSFMNTPLPFKLSMSIHGLANIDFGNIFRINLLPKSYIDTTYFQIMQVAHTVESSGWKTDIETQFRIRSKSKQESSKISKYKRNYLSADWVRNQITDQAVLNRFPWYALYKVLPSPTYTQMFDDNNLRNSVGAITKAWGIDTDWYDQDSIKDWREKWYPKGLAYLNTTQTKSGTELNIFEFECRFDHNTQGDENVEGYLTTRNKIGKYGSRIQVDTGNNGIMAGDSSGTAISGQNVYIDPYSILQVFDSSEIYIINNQMPSLDIESMQKTIDGYSWTSYTTDDEFYSHKGWPVSDMFKSMKEDWKYAGGMFATRFTEERGVNAFKWESHTVDKPIDFDGNQEPLDGIGNTSTSFGLDYDMNGLDYLDGTISTDTIDDHIHSIDFDLKIEQISNIEFKRNSYTGYMGFTPYVPHKEKLMGMIHAGRFVWWQKSWWDDMLARSTQGALNFLRFMILFTSKTPSDKVLDTFGDAYTNPIWFDSLFSGYDVKTDLDEFASSKIIDDTGNPFDNGANLYNNFSGDNQNTWLFGDTPRVRLTPCDIFDGYTNNKQCADNEVCFCHGQYSGNNAYTDCNCIT